ncbi:MAG: hypothetical protein WA821_16650 [Anaerolineales bacterium]
METNRIFSIAQFLIQVSAAILPIGVGASGLIVQQNQTNNVWLALIFIWFGLAVIVLSIYLNLAVLTAKLDNRGQYVGLEKKFRSSTRSFTLGIVLLLLAPPGYVMQNSQPAVSISREAVTLVQTPNLETKTGVIITVKPAKSGYSITPFNPDPACVEANPLGDQTDAVSSTLFSSWEVVVQPNCPTADYVIAFDVQAGGNFVAQKKLTIAVAPQP